MVEGTLAFNGGVSSIWSVTRVTEERANISCRHPLQKAGAVIPPLVSGLSNPHDLGGWKYPDSYGGPWMQGFKTNGGTTIRRYYFCFAVDNPSSQLDTAHFFSPHYNGHHTPANGRLTVGTVKHGASPTTKYGLVVYEYDTGAWGALGATPTDEFDSDGTIYYGTLEVDMSGAPHVVSLWVGDASAMMDGGGTDKEYIEAVALVNNNNAVVTATPCFWNFAFALGGKSAAQMDTHSFEIFGQDDTGSDTARIDYYGAAAQPHVFTMITSDDVAGGAWTPANQAAPGCATEKRRTLDDPFDDEDGTDDHIYMAGDGNPNDQQFEMNDDYHVVAQAPTIYGLHVVSASHDLGTFPTHNLAHCPTEGGAPDADAGITEGGAYNYHRWGTFYELTPGGAGAPQVWTGALLDEFRTGVRNDHASETRYAHHLFVQVIGTQLKRPANAAACPVVARRRSPPGAIF